MKLKPINLSLFHRSLISDNRQWQGYAFRFVMLIIIGVILTQVVAMSQYRMTFAIGKNFFQAVMVGNLVFVTILGITLCSTAITEEKDNSSLGLLLMTGISTMSLLMSKSFSKLLIAIMLIVMQLPFTLLAITLGGISLTQIFYAYVSLICYTILVANVALLFSVISSKSTISSSLTFTVLVTFNVLTPIWDSTSFLSPFVRINKIMSTAYSGGAFEINEICNLIFSLIFFTISYICFNHFSRSVTGGIAFATPKVIKKYKKGFFSPKRAWNQAIIWKDFHFFTGGFATYGLFLCAAILIITGYLAIYYNDRASFPSIRTISSTVITTAIVLLIVQVVFVGSTLFSKEVWDKTHSSLMMLPISLKAMAYKKVAGASLIFVPMLILLVIGFCMSNYNSHYNMFYRRGSWIVSITYSFLLALFYLHLATFISLFIRYGAFAVGGVLLLLLQLIILLPGGIIRSLSFGLSHYELRVARDLASIAIYLILIFVFHRLIGKKLVKLAAE